MARHHPGVLMAAMQPDPVAAPGCNGHLKMREANAI
jgi:hypothetical protein